MQNPTLSGLNESHLAVLQAIRLAEQYLIDKRAQEHWDGQFRRLEQEKNFTPGDRFTFARQHDVVSPNLIHAFCVATESDVTHRSVKVLLKDLEAQGLVEVVETDTGILDRRLSIQGLRFITNPPKLDTVEDLVMWTSKDLRTDVHQSVTGTCGAGKTWLTKGLVMRHAGNVVVFDPFNEYGDVTTRVEVSDSASRLGDGIRVVQPDPEVPGTQQEFFEYALETLTEELHANPEKANGLLVVVEEAWQILESPHSELVSELFALLHGKGYLVLVTHTADSLLASEAAKDFLKEAGQHIIMRGIRQLRDETREALGALSVEDLQWLLKKGNMGPNSLGVLVTKNNSSRFGFTL